ncbi:hypothetical protein L0P88_15600 [Muricauda sp. SCSIO 64092]|uniref:hypothetical protein n=1 Tax=Allomuricauda sp. SCSIO 64092 TaxID=2908842 RepID=UPI001FF2259D|nr:hypothetical protein [Muricauda sp. SCSIO 64092]UOY05370.1 hypothetical protein L0P88_15600 [Muricauda sp. SCSIO 64092]
MVQSSRNVPFCIRSFLLQLSLYGQKSMETILGELRPEIFLPGKVGTGDLEHGSALLKDGSMLPFLGEGHGSNPYFSLHSKKLFFVGNRPTGDSALKNRNIRYVNVERLKSTLNAYINGLVNIYCLAISALVKQFDIKGL